MKLFLALIIALGAINAQAAIKGAPFIPEEDIRFDSLENQVSANAGISRLYAKAIYDVSIQGGASTSHSLGVVLPAGAVITDLSVYINTAFTQSGQGSVALQCAGTNDLMDWHDLSLVGKDTMHRQSWAASSAGSGGAYFPLGNASDFVAVNSGASVPSACTVNAVVRSGAISGNPQGGNPMTAGKLTAIISYFIR